MLRTCLFRKYDVQRLSREFGGWRVVRLRSVGLGCRATRRPAWVPTIFALYLFVVALIVNSFGREK